MKNTFKNIIAVLAIAVLCNACNNDDSAITNISGTGNLGVEFDNSFGANDLILNAANTPTSNNEVLKVTKIKYIISNIVLYNQYGVSFAYPKSQSYFIVDEADEATHVLELTGIPAGNYTKIKFGIGVDQPQYALGESNQGDFYATAQHAGMISDWASGYRFLSFEGQFTSPSVTTATSFTVHTARTDADYNYKEVTLDLPSQALVRTTITPEIHIVADLSKIIDGTNKMRLSDNSNITSGANMSLVAANSTSMFTVAHVHND